MAIHWDQDSPPTYTKQLYWRIPGAYVITTTSVKSHEGGQFSLSKKKYIEFPPGFVLPPDTVLTPAEILDLQAPDENPCTTIMIAQTNEASSTSSASDRVEKC